MYVARLGSGFTVKRMPYTGPRHAPSCPSYEPPAELSGLSQVLGSAIKEDPDNGTTTVRLGFSLSKLGGRSTDPGSAEETGSVSGDGTRLTLRGLLHYLWGEAELNRWHPGFAGKRSWWTVRKHLLAAAERTFIRGEKLSARLYVPEVFNIDRREEIAFRRSAQLARASSAGSARTRLALLIGEVKDIIPARHGHKAIIKHAPDQAFIIDASLHARMTRTFEDELSLWGAYDSMHLVMIATFGLNPTGVATVEQVSLMPTSANWLPVEHAFDQMLLERLTHDSRQFIKSLRYNASPRTPLASVVLTDAVEGPVAMYVEAPGGTLAANAPVAASATCVDWIWRIADGPMPTVPSQQFPAHSAR
jgi:hypothetical protein